MDKQQNEAQAQGEMVTYELYDRTAVVVYPKAVAQLVEDFIEGMATESELVLFILRNAKIVAQAPAVEPPAGDSVFHQPGHPMDGWDEATQTWSADAPAVQAGVLSEAEAEDDDDAMFQQRKAPAEAQGLSGEQRMAASNKVYGEWHDLIDPLAKVMPEHLYSDLYATAECHQWWCLRDLLPQLKPLLEKHQWTRASRKLTDLTAHWC